MVCFGGIMKYFQFGRLFFEIFGKDQPNIDWIQEQGLLAVKIGQTFALRPDFISPNACRTLGKLYQHNQSLPEDQFTLLLNSSVGEDWRSHFTQIDPIPLASASIGQVHRGVLNSGDLVVIKAVKKNFQKDFREDLTRARNLIKGIIKVYPKLRKVADPEGILDLLEENTLMELDLRNERLHRNELAEIAEKGREIFDLQELDFPKIYEELSNENVMVSQYLNGPTFDDLLSQQKLPYELLLKLFHIHGYFIFGAGVFHGDIHPGNIIWQDDKIWFIDNGAIGRVNERIRKGLLSFFEAMSEGDFVNCAQRLNEMSEQSISEEVYQEFEKKFLQLYADFDGKTVAEVSLTQKMMDTIRLGVNSGMVFSRGMFPVIKSLMYLDGMVLRCNPNAVLLKDMTQFISEFKKISEGSVKP